MAQKKMVFYLSDEIFAIGVPILVTLEAQRTAILTIQLASDRSAQTWQAHVEDLGTHLFHSIGMASDRGAGLMAGYQAACQDAAAIVLQVSQSIPARLWPLCLFHPLDGPEKNGVLSQ